LLAGKSAETCARGARRRSRSLPRRRRRASLFRERAAAVSSPRNSEFRPYPLSGSPHRAGERQSPPCQRGNAGSTSSAERDVRLYEPPTRPDNNPGVEDVRSVVLQRRIDVIMFPRGGTRARTSAARCGNANRERERERERERAVNRVVMDVSFAIAINHQSGARSARDHRSEKSRERAPRRSRDNARRDATSFRNGRRMRGYYRATRCGPRNCVCRQN